MTAVHPPVADAGGIRRLGRLPALPTPGSAATATATEFASSRGPAPRRRCRPRPGERPGCAAPPSAASGPCQSAVATAAVCRLLAAPPLSGGSSTVGRATGRPIDRSGLRIPAVGRQRDAGWPPDGQLSVPRTGTAARARRRGRTPQPISPVAASPALPSALGAGRGCRTGVRPRRIRVRRSQAGQAPPRGAAARRAQPSPGPLPRTGPGRTGGDPFVRAIPTIPGVRHRLH